MIRLSKKDAAKMGFIKQSTDRETQKRLEKKAHTRARAIKKNKKKVEKKINVVEKISILEKCHLIKVSASRYVINMEDLL